MSKFRTGTEEAAKSQPLSFNRVEFFRMGDGDIEVIRWLMDADEWQTVDVHTQVPVQKACPKDDKGNDLRKNWPKAVPVVCRRTKLPEQKQPDPVWLANMKVKYPLYPYLYPDCWVDDNIRKPDGKPMGKVSRTYSLCVMRDQVLGDGTPAMGGEAMKGKVIGYRDRMKEVAVTDAQGKLTGDKEMVRDIRIVQQAYSNFFQHFEGMAGVHGTLLDRDYWIKRKGDDKDTEYQVVHLDPMTMPGADGQPVKFDLRDPYFVSRYGITIDADGRHYPEDMDVEAHIDRQMGDRYYGMYIDPRLPQVMDRQTGTNDGASQTPIVVKPETESTPDQLAALKARVTNYSTVQGQAPAEQPSEAPAPAEAPPAAPPVAEQPAPPPQPEPSPQPVAVGGPIVVPDFG